MNILKRPAVLLFLAVALSFLTRFWFLGSSLWHDDAFNFVDKAISLAVDGRYTNAHSTGYPLWIVVLAGALSLGHVITGKWLIMSIPNLVSVIFGSFLILPVFQLAKKVFRSNDYYSIAVSLIIILNPVLWRWSEVAMSDIPALFLILCSWAFFYNFLERQNRRDLFWSGLFLYLSLMIRPIYGLSLAVFAFSWIYRYRFSDLRKTAVVFTGYALAVGACLLTYFLINDFSLQLFFAGYGSTTPGIKDIYHTIGITLKTIGPMMPLIFVGAWYLYKNNREFFYSLEFGAAIFTLYASSWYANGSFDIERYNVIATVLLLMVACYCLAPNWGTRGLFGIAALVALVILGYGLASPVFFYRTYGFDPNFFTNYKIKAGQVSQEKLVDGDATLYQDLAEHIDKNAVVLHWNNDWVMPKLLLGGAHLQIHPELVGISSKEQLKEELKLQRGRRVYFLRGAYETLIQINQGQYEIKNEILNNRSIVYFVDL